MFKEYQPNEVIVDRAVELWKRMLRDPKFDNGSSSLSCLFAQGLAYKLASSNPSPEAKLEEFGRQLKSLLMREVSVEELKDEPETEKSYKHYVTSLSVDYHPDLTLSVAATRAGLHGGMLGFPWKTSMHIYETYLCLGAGYCAPAIFHYPLKGGRWLLTQLSGDDISKVIDYVEGGTPTFEVEGVPDIKPDIEPANSVL